ncbi:hypothetical protein DRQ20_00115 [bacterium]|nr:MAG: hypothetical protein DRQ20_00115 [bacterium]
MKKYVVLSLFLALLLYGGVTGKIVGRVYDAETGEGLPAANVIIEGTVLGSATDPDGYFIILDVPPGVYSVTARVIGYEPMTIENVKVSADLTTTLEFPLRQTVIEKKPVVVVAKRPIIKKDLTTSVAIVDRKEMETMPLTSVQAVVTQQAGVVQHGGLHIRGGRATEVVYMVDGIEVRDPYTGGFDSHIPQIGVEETSVFTGGFGAEYGSAQSGVINVVAREGGSRFSGEVTFWFNDFGKLEAIQNFVDKNYEVDSLGNKIEDSPHLNQERLKRLDFHVGGPIGKKVRYSFTSEITKTLGRFPHDDRWRKTFQGKLTWRVTSISKLAFTWLYNDEIYHDYSDAYGAYGCWKYLLDRLPEYHAVSYLWGLGYTHAIGANTHFEVKISNYTTKLRSNVFEDGTFDLNGDGVVNPDTAAIYDTIIDPFTGDTTVVEYPSDRNGIDDYADVDGDRRVEIDSFGESEWDWPDLETYPFDRNPDSLGYYTSGYYRIAWHDDKKEIYTISGYIKSQIGRYHEVKTGGEFKYYSLFNYTADMASGDNIYMEYTTGLHPRCGAWYIQDKMEFPGLIVNAGIRFDWFDPNSYYPADIYDPVVDVTRGGEIKNPVKVSPKYKWSPRIGFSHPITERDVLHFTYGHYFQIPPMYILYRNYTWDFTGAFPLVGNADIQPEKTVSYEVGIKHAFSDVMRVDVTFYMKDITGLTDTEQIFFTPVRYYTRYTNADYGSVRGVEITFFKRKGGTPWFMSWNCNYTYQIARGKSSSTRQNYDFIWAGYEIPAEEHYLDWDQRHTLRVSVTFSAGKEERLLGMSDWGITFLTNYGSGYPWTPPSRSRIQRINEERMPYTLRTDVRFYKHLIHKDRFKLTFLVDIVNLFNRDNLLDIADEEWYAVYGDPEGRFHDPTVWDTKRVMRFGIECKW